METTTNDTDSPKKNPYDNLTKEELIKKCKGLVVIAQKAKQAKTDTQAEVDKLKQILEKLEREKNNDRDSIKTLQELVDSLTEQKLNYITELDVAQNQFRGVSALCKNYEIEINKYKKTVSDFEKQLSEIKIIMSSLDDERTSLKRQNDRLIEENEQLINQLSELEAKAVEFNNIGIQQREQLQILEEKLNAVSTSNQNNLCQNNLNELNEKIAKLCDDIHNRDEECLNLRKQLFNCDDKLKQVTSENILEREKTGKANVKLRSYKDKIMKCAVCINQLKNSRFILLKTVKDYSESIPKWQEDLLNASKILDNELVTVRKENELLQKQISDLQNDCHSLSNLNLEYKKEINNLKHQNSEQITLLNALENKESSNDPEVEVLKLQIMALENEKHVLVKEKLSARDNLFELENVNKNLIDKINNLNNELEAVKLRLQSMTSEKKSSEYKIQTCQNEIKHLNEQCQLFKKDNENLLDLNGLLKDEVETLKLSLEQPKDYSETPDLNVSLQADIVKLETKLSAYKQENASLLNEIKESHVRSQQFDTLLAEYEEAKSKLLTYKSENIELLNEMKEINQVFKERGESISKQQKAIIEMERLIETLENDRDAMKKDKEDMQERIASLQEEIKVLKQKAPKLNEESDFSEKTSTEKDFLITTLKEEIEKLKQQQNASLELPNDDMSTSTISRAEEFSRIKELDETFADKYTKLRLFALKLKKKFNDTVAQLQNIELEKARLEKVLNDININTNQDGQQSNEVVGDREAKESIITNNRISEICVKEKSEEVQKMEIQSISLSEELNNAQALIYELEKVKGDLAAKETELKNEIDEHKITKDNLDKARKDAKKKSILNLEMEAYERSMKDLTNKLEDNKKKITQMESTIDTQQGTINAMKTQIKLLQDQVETEENQNRLIKQELQNALDEVNDRENLIQVKKELIMKLESDIEDVKRKYDEINIEMTSLIAEKEKTILNLSEEKFDLANRLKKVENEFVHLVEKLQITNSELQDLKAEYTSYKVRAQAVLRQNQVIDHSQEEQLKEEAAALKAKIETLSAKVTTCQQEMEELQSVAETERRRASDAAAELARASQRTTRLQTDLTRLGSQLDAERCHHKLQVSTLTQCYKKQINELEMRIQKETQELTNQLLLAQKRLGSENFAKDNLNRNTDAYMIPIIPSKEEGSDGELDINVTMLPREEGEGSEFAPSPPLSKPYIPSSSGRRSPVPLERLLEEGVPEDEATDMSFTLTPEQELSELKRKLEAQLQRVKHLTVLLAESERDCARHAQMNELLKAEVRRALGSLERTQHAHNAEYMKNVTLKFLTLPPGDERIRLVPVLQKILTLSPEETHRLNAVATGADPNVNRGWGSYLPWPGGKLG